MKFVIVFLLVIFAGCSFGNFNQKEIVVDQNRETDSIIEPEQGSSVNGDEEEEEEKEEGGGKSLTTEEIREQMVQDKDDASDTSVDNLEKLPEVFQMQDDDVEVVEVVENKDAKACVDDGGVFNSTLEKCFFNGQTVDDDTQKAADAKMQISDDDSEKESARKDCVNNGGVFNSLLGECFN